MRVTPLDIIQKQFSPARRGGWEPDEVRQFLDDVRDAMEEVLKDNQRLKDEIAARDADIEELRSGEGDLKSTLLMARRLTDDIHRNARREADVIVGEARLEAERILLTATDERREMQADIVRLRSGRARLIADLRAVLDAYQQTVAELERDPPAAR
jgi:cell division initiation protein